MKLYTNTVSDNLLCILKKLMDSDVFKDFRLVGGTALSLQRGHRRSIDIDLFTDLPYGAMPKTEIKNYLESSFSICDGSDTLSEDALGYHIRLGENQSAIIKLDLFYTDEFIFQYKNIDGIRLADEREIAAMKMLAISGPIKRQKDYWDIHELLQDYSLENMIEWGIKRHPYSLTRDEIIIGLKKISDVEEAPEGIDALRPLDYWELKVLDILDELKKLN